MKRYIYATVLLSVILPAVLVAPFHHHARLYPDDNQCDACDQHLPHQGHLASASGTDIVIKDKTRLSLYVIGSNLIDAVYCSHLSRLKYIGVYNMGRNVTFKLVVPF